MTTTTAPIALEIPEAARTAAKAAVVALVDELGPVGAALALAMGGPELDRLLTAVYSIGPVTVTVDATDIVDRRPA